MGYLLDLDLKYVDFVLWLTQRVIWSQNTNLPNTYKLTNSGQYSDLTKYPNSGPYFACPSVFVVL